MSFRYKKSLQTITLFIVTCVANAYVFAFIPDASADTTLQAGVLNAFDAPSVRVNGNAAQDGITILSGAEVKTNKNSGATINLHRLGKIELSLETSASLVFTAQSVELRVASGQARLTTYKGVSGVLTGADGKILKTDSSLEVSSVGNAGTSTGAASVPVVSSDGLFGMGLWETAAVVGGVLGGTVLALVNTNTDNASQGSVSRVKP